SSRPGAFPGLGRRKAHRSGAASAPSGSGPAGCHRSKSGLGQKHGAAQVPGPWLCFRGWSGGEWFECSCHLPLVGLNVLGRVFFPFHTSKLDDTDKLSSVYKHFFKTTSSHSSGHFDRLSTPAFFSNPFP